MIKKYCLELEIPEGKQGEKGNKGDDGQGVDLCCVKVKIIPYGSPANGRFVECDCTDDN